MRTALEYIGGVIFLTAINALFVYYMGVVP